MVARRVRARQKGIKGYKSAMRPGWLGNPFSLDDYSLEKSLEYYERYLRRKLERDSEFSVRFDNLIDENIGCTCPLDQSCHVDIIIKILTERSDKTNEEWLDAQYK